MPLANATMANIDAINHMLQKSTLMALTNAIKFNINATKVNIDAISQCYHGQH